MSRKKQAIKRELVLDPVFNSKLVTQLVNAVMKDGKKIKAQNIVYQALAIAKEKAKEESLKIFEKAIENTKPELEVKTRRIGGANYQVPIEISDDRKTTLAVRWLVAHARKRSSVGTMAQDLALEIFDAYNGTGSSIKKRDEIHRAAEANKAFAHYKW